MWVQVPPSAIFFNSAYIMSKNVITDVEKAFAELMAPYSSDVQELARKTRELVREVIPDAREEVDFSAHMLVATFIPGTYKGAIVTIMLQKSYVNIMFAKGVELMEVDETGLLEGTGKKARHIKVRDGERIKEPAVRALIKEAAKRTPRE